MGWNWIQTYTCVQFNLNNSHFRKMIVKLVKRHNIRHVAMQVSVLNLDNIGITHFWNAFNQLCLDDFLRDVVKLNCTLDLYEIGSPMVQVCFEATRIFWEEKSEKLNQEGISMRILTCGDLMFELSDLRQRFIRTHLEVQRPMMSDNNTPTFYKHSLSSPRQWCKQFSSILSNIAVISTTVHCNK